MSEPYRNQIICGDALSVLKTLPSEYIQTVVTSPPYLWQRDYGAPGQIGLETSPAAYIAKLVEVFHEVKRVLRPDGTCWINIGDTSANDDKWGGTTGGKHVVALHGINVMRERRYSGMKPKDLLLIPHRLAIALQDDGWWIRGDNIWFKTNPLPEPVLDRPSRSHEHVLLLSKNSHYYYDANAVRQPLRAKTYTTYGTKHRPQGNDALGKVKSDNWGKSLEARKPRLDEDGEIAGANLRDVWPLSTYNYEGKHYATFPPKLAEICILAGSSPKACQHCLSPWKRVTARVPMHIRPGPKAGSYGSRTTDGLSGTMLSPARVETTGWEPTCTCEGNTGEGHCVILDCFMGAGTTALVALQYHRDYLGIELNPAYCDLARKRIETIQPVLWQTGA